MNASRQPLPLKCRRSAPEKNLWQKNQAGGR
jgi:hypothetical protein